MRRGSVPTLSVAMALGVLLLNLVVPGSGTAFAALRTGHPMLGRALAQFLLAILIVGWVWALRTSIQCLRLARDDPTALSVNGPPAAPQPIASDIVNKTND